MQCDVDATRDMNRWEQQTEPGKSCLLLIRSLDEGLDVPAAVGTFHTVLVEARTGHKDDALIGRVMVALFPMSPPLRAVVICRGSFFQVNLPGVFVLRRAITSKSQHERDASTPHGVNFNLFPSDTGCWRRWRTRHVNVFATHFGSRAA